MNPETLKQFDPILENPNIAALVMRQCLKPVEGDNAVIFPPTYAGIGYNIDTFNTAGETRNVCVIDSVGSQANRMEPLFKTPPYDDLVPHIKVTVRKQPLKGQEEGDLIEEIDLLDVGHRIADAVVRFSNGADEISQAFQSVQKDAVKMANLAPTSLVFGCWDSRGSSVKLPRIVRSTITAYNVYQLKRSAQYVPATERYEEVFDKLSEKERKKFADVGMTHVPSTEKPGGVFLDSNSRVQKDVILSLSALRALRSESDENTVKLRRYLFGLSLVAVTAPQNPLLRMGCELTLDSQNPAKWEIVGCDGKRQTFDLSFERALTYAKTAAEAFGVGESKAFTFDPKKANEELKKLTEKGKKGEEGQP